MGRASIVAEHFAREDITVECNVTVELIKDKINGRLVSPISFSLLLSWTVIMESIVLHRRRVSSQFFAERMGAQINCITFVRPASKPHRSQLLALWRQCLSVVWYACLKIKVV